MSRHYPGDKIPIVGPWISRIGKVHDIMTTACDVDPEIWVEAFFYGVPRMLVAQLKPTPQDFIDDRFGVTHKRKTKRKFHFVDELIDPNFKPGTLGWAAFKLFEWKEKIGFYMIVIDSATELAYTWSSMAYQWSGCDDPNAPSCKNVWDFGAVRYESGGYIANMSTVYARGGANNGPDFVSMPGDTVASPCLEIGVSRNTGGLPQCEYTEFQLVTNDGHPVTEPIIMNPNSETGSWQRRVVRNWSTSFAPKVYKLKVINGAGWYKFEGSLTLNGYKERGLAADP